MDRLLQSAAMAQAWETVSSAATASTPEEMEGLLFTSSNPATTPQ